MLKKVSADIPGVHIGEVPPLIKQVAAYDRIQSDYLQAGAQYYRTPTSENAQFLKNFSAYTISAYRSVVRALIDTETEGTIRAISTFTLNEEAKRIEALGKLTNSLNFVSIAPYAQEFTDWMQDTVIENGNHGSLEEGLVDTMVGLINCEKTVLHQHILYEAAEATGDLSGL